MQTQHIGFAERLSAVIGLIYETASDESLWPQLLEGLAELVLESKGAAPVLPNGAHKGALTGLQGLPLTLAPSEAEQYLLACLAPHFTRSQEMQRALQETEIERDLLERVMDRLPLGMAIVDAQGRAISMNRAMLSLLQTGAGLALQDGCLVSAQPQQLPQAIAQVLARRQSHACLRLPSGVDGPPISDDAGTHTGFAGNGLSLWISHFGAGKPADRAMVLAASPGSRALSEEALGAFFGLSPAEARLTQQLALGQAIEDAAQALGISRNTAKTQLKKVYAKVGVKRQPDLVQAIYASPLWLDLGQAEPAALARRADLQNAMFNPTSLVPGARLRLPDGRWISWSDSGDPQGWPVVFCHAFFQGQHDRPPDESVLTALGLRLLIPDRPGCGDSDHHPHGKVDDWPVDVAHMLAYLGIDQFSVLSWSVGTPYALALAQHFGDRVRALLLATPVMPLREVADLRYYSPKSRLILMVALFTPSLVPAMVRTMAKSVKKDVFAAIEAFLMVAPPSEATLLKNPWFISQRARVALREAKRDPEVIAQECMRPLRGWTLRVPAPSMPCKIWHGDADPEIHWGAAQALSKALGGIPMHLVPGAGHYLIWCHWQSILQDLKAMQTTADAQEFNPLLPA
jgi:pimeloyl-ACP methyl ester carboxylesterase/DNA-binding CsgD family transcriptional regulator/PAS domain-containing protein